MFEVDVAGLAELEGGDSSHRLAYEPVANVFDEFRGYDADRRKPSYCAVTLAHSANPRGVMLTVADDGAGFQNERDIWTLFGSTAKRGAAGVAGRFNAGDKQLIAVARQATVKTNAVTVTFADGKREVTRHRSQIVSGTIVEALMPWSLQDMAEIRESLKRILPPEGLTYSVDGETVVAPVARCIVNVTLPTVLLTDGVLRNTTRKTAVRVIKCDKPTLFELGVPVCDLSEIGFPWSLDVQQKVPVPMSRNTVSPQYLFRLIGSVIEQASMDGVTLLTQEEQGAGFMKGALEWIREPEALQATVKSLFGDNAVRLSSDPIANAQAAASGATLVSGRWFGADTRRRMEESRTLPTSKDVFGGTESAIGSSGEDKVCPRCGGAGTI